MGTLFRAVVHADSEFEAERASQAAFARIRALDEQLSDYLETSELSRLSASSGSGDFFAVGADLWRVMTLAQSFSELSDGAFDVTAGPVIGLWRRARRQGELPSPRRIAEAVSRVDWRAVTMDADSRSIRLDREHMQLDLGGIAKGYAVDAALDVFARHGLTSVLVVGGGDVGVRDAPPGQRGWRVEVVPFDDPGTRLTLCLNNAAVSTSGDAEQALVLDGKRYSHIVDPRTGSALVQRASATVVAGNSTTADALATTLCVLGHFEGLAWAQRAGAFEARLVRESASGWESAATPGFEGLILSAPSTIPPDHAVSP